MHKNKKVIRLSKLFFNNYIMKSQILEDISSTEAESKTISVMDDISDIRAQLAQDIYENLARDEDLV
ncbi:hypothetical protein HOK00_03120 [bacterium]|nr:hypothetical protein [bacterium]